MPDPIKDAIESNATAGIKKVEVDGETVEAMSIKDQIEADRYLSGKTGLTKTSMGIYTRKQVPPGAP